ncbi:DNA topoisomerase 3 [Toxocara canis]|uniref:DNA topoisomerase n=1 Tax=Toxocara canis TaxID=6265 RepID=A0A0B2W574_TOXCA|nr:DNA topoisomerase 3 [Toxocara canis]
MSKRLRLESKSKPVNYIGQTRSKGLRKTVTGGGVRAKFLQARSQGWSWSWRMILPDGGDRIEARLTHVLGDFVLEAVSLADSGAVKLLTDPVTGRSVYQVGTLPSQSTFSCLPSVNYCQCGFFQENDESNCAIAMTSVAGHLLQHRFPDAYKSWTETPMASLFSAPVIKGVISGMEPIRETLVEESRRSDVLVIWTDCDREGEGIGAEVASVCLSIKPNMPVYRARFSEITGAAIWRALNNLGRLDDRVVDAVECRQSELDLRIGAAFTRLQTLHLRNNFASIFREFKDIVSYGSCQFPTLGFVVERFKAIQEFVVESFWKLFVRHRRAGVDVVFEWDRVRLFDRDVVQILLDACEEKVHETRVISVKQKPKSKWRPTALDTIELEKLAVRKLHMSAKDAMAVAEKLYSRGFISYPRTETNKFPSNLDLSPLVEQQTANAEWGEFAQEVLDRGPNPRNGTKSDEAHPPIHPLKFASPNELVGYEWSVYELVVRHFLACLSIDARGQETKVQIEMGGENFTATGLVIEEFGYLKVYKYEKWGDKSLPQYRENELLHDCKVSMNEGHTQPPPLLSEADLIALMDKYGIGTDATHAEHIETIKQRRYAALNNEKRFVPGYLGLALVDGYDRMGYAMSKPHMRADLESQLKLICLGQRTKDEVLAEQISRYQRIFEQTEVKVTMLSNAFREYLNASQQQGARRGPQDPFPVVTGGSTDDDSGGPPPAPPPTRRRGQGTAANSNRGRGRAGNAASTRGRGRPRSHAPANEEPEEASTSVRDVELLQKLSIVNMSQPPRRAKANGNKGNAATTNGTSSGAKLCFCGEPAMRLQVKKEPARQKTIMERLTSIRGNKQRILDTLREMKQKLGDDEEPDKELMAKMIASYDLLSAQEEEYMKIMQQIVSIRENAAEDVQHEVEEVKSSQGEANAETKESTVAGAEPIEADEQSTEAEKSERKGGSEAEWKEVEEELAKLGSVAGEAVAASIMNEKLVEKLQLHRNKKAALDQLRQKEAESQRGAANEALQQVELARLKVAAEQEQIERKRKTLERLRREAVRRGIKLGPGPASEPDIVVEAPPEPKSVTEAKLRAKLNAKKKVYCVIVLFIGSEKLAAIEARKQRMREIQSQLLRPVITESEMDETFQKAQQRLKSLTAMREHLEELRESGEALPEETVAMLERQLVEEENVALKNEADGVEQRIAQEKMKPALDYIEQVVQNAKSEFEKAMLGGACGDTEDLAPGYRLSMNDSRRLREIEESLKEHKQLLLSLSVCTFIMY